MNASMQLLLSVMAMFLVVFPNLAVAEAEAEGESGAGQLTAFGVLSVMASIIVAKFV